MIIIFLSYLLIGGVAGFLSGLLGIGGGLVVVPALAYVYTQQAMPHVTVMHMAVGTSFMAMMVTASSSLRAHIKHKIAVWSVFKQLLPGLIVGTVVGAIVADFLHSQILRFLFGAFVVFIGLRLLFVVPSEEQHPFPARFKLWCLSSLIGSLAGMLGTGGGAMVMPLLTRYGVSFRQAVAVSAACGLLIALVGAVSFMLTGLDEPGLPAWSTGYIYWPGAVGVALVSAFFAPLGAALSHHLSVLLLRYIFIVLLFLIAVHMFVG